MNNAGGIITTVSQVPGLKVSTSSMVSAFHRYEDPMHVRASFPFLGISWIGERGDGWLMIPLDVVLFLL